MGRIQRSWALAKQSYLVLKAQPQLAFFPIISGIATVIVGISFFLPMVLTGSYHQGERPSPFHYAVMFAFYAISSFVVIFFNAGLVSCAYEALNGRPTDWRSGLANAGKHLGAIVIWSLIAATVGTILRYIGERTGFVGQLVVGLLGFAWSLLTYFVVPVIVIESSMPVPALKKSGGMLKNSWGDRIVANIGIGTATGLLMAVAVIPVAIGISLFIAGLWPLGLVALGLACLYLLFVTVISTTLGGIFNTALYIYASTGQVPTGFSEEYLKDAFRLKKQSKMWAS